MRPRREHITTEQDVTYLVDENIQRGVDGAPLAAGH